MATTPVPADRRVEVGRVISRGFTVIGRAPATMFSIAFLFGALPQGIVGYIFRTSGFMVTASDVDASRITDIIVASIVVGLAVTLLAYVAQGALVPAVIAAANGRRGSFAECATIGVQRLLDLLALSLLITLACWAGIILLIVPGIILYLIWSVATQALVAEQIGVFAALGRSARLTKGARWSIFGLALIVAIFYFVVASVLSGVRIALLGLPAAQTAAMSGEYGLFMVLNAIVSTISLVIWGAIQTSLYIELRNWKDGPGAARLADIFA